MVYLSASILFVVAVFASTAVAFESGAYDSETVAAFRAGVATEFGLPTGGSYGKICTDGCALGHAIGQLVRLAFHDAAGGGGAGGLGGPDGCIDPTASDNAGLAPVATRIRSVRDATAANITLADAFVLAANYAIEIATTLDPSDAGNLGRLGVESPVPLILPFRSGRNDSASCSGVDTPLLTMASSRWSGTSGSHSTTSVFGRMGLSTPEIVALLGAHTVGRLTASNSGINGVWVKDTSASFSNRYYRDLIGVPWVKNNAQSNDVWQAGPLNAPTPGVMLRPDVELIFNTTTSSGAATCPSFNLNAGNTNGCPRQTASIDSVLLYASSQATWHASFSDAWTKMVEFNSEGLMSNPVSTPPSSSSQSSDDSDSWIIPVAVTGGVLAGLLFVACVMYYRRNSSATQTVVPLKSSTTPTNSRSGPTFTAP